jgi:hypothetical protein
MHFWIQNEFINILGQFKQKNFYWYICEMLFLFV